ncbi:hypothetical protein DP113_17290 [Brasilonema octagenarum UFV-E1]|uniref:Uncharacterized protein n=1 Tax=Brasilonema sennae CENA114 TaxID=415709 RepID=A0A856MIG2_9CYAN|nr:hypothetical protein [Brasilonema sennae]QDL09431.1 hypothetical protein DP114_17355 [Brasilonema sennae CENA114]QDL15787.1 hypothetical protein DP113_17290 [Brasilonema octagenarum UFV-E1]
MRVAFFLSTAIACTTVIGGYTADLSQAVQLRDGKVYFVQPPTLLGAVTTYKDTYVWGGAIR